MVDYQNNWWLVQLTPEAAEAHDRRVYKAPEPIMLGWKPYIYRATKGAVSQWACHTEEQLQVRLRQYGLRIVEWREWSEGMRTARMEPLA